MPRELSQNYLAADLNRVREQCTPGPCSVRRHPLCPGGLLASSLAAVRMPLNVRLVGAGRVQPGPVWGVGAGLGKHCLGALALPLPTGAKSGDASLGVAEGWRLSRAGGQTAAPPPTWPWPGPQGRGCERMGVRGPLPSEPALWAAKPLRLLSAWAGAHPFLSPGLPAAKASKHSGQTA